MSSSPGGKRNLSARLALGVVLGLFLGANARAQTALPETPAPQVVLPQLSLSECLAIGLERRPAIKAAMSSYNSALIGYRGIDNLPLIAAFARPDLPVRKEQLLRSITLAQAGVEKSKQETVYDVTRMYYTYIYAHQQELTAADVIGRLLQFSTVVEQFLKSKPNDPKAKLNESTLNGIQITISEIRSSALRAELGRRQALVALKEAMGGDFDREFVPRDTKLPILNDAVLKERVLEFALRRRPELVMAAAGSEAFRLEICAQMKARGLQAQTLGAGRDIHTQQIPSPSRDGDYKPGGLLPEMPVTLVGKREDRVARAVELSRRADAGAEQVAILVRVEAENAYITWDIATKRMAEAKKRSDSARKTADDTKLAAMFRMDSDVVLSNETAAGRALADYAEATFEHLKTLATLERTTGGGIQPAFPGR